MKSLALVMYVSQLKRHSEVAVWIPGLSLLEDFSEVIERGNLGCPLGGLLPKDYHHQLEKRTQGFNSSTIWALSWEGQTNCKLCTGCIRFKKNRRRKKDSFLLSKLSSKWERRRETKLGGGAAAEKLLWNAGNQTWDQSPTVPSIPTPPPLSMEVLG